MYKKIKIHCKPAHHFFTTILQHSNKWGLELLKFVFVLILSLSFHSQVHSQEDSLNIKVAEKKLKAIYVGSGGGVSSFGTNGASSLVDLSLNIITAKGSGFSIISNTSSPIAENIPNDYSSGLCLFSCPTPKDRFQSFSFLYSYHIDSGKDIRFVFGAGPSILRVDKLHFVRKSSFFLGSNYSIYKTRHNFGGLKLFVKMDISIVRHYGFQLGLLSNINTAQSSFQIMLSQIIGKVDGKKSSMKSRREKRRERKAEALK